MAKFEQQWQAYRARAEAALQAALPAAPNSVSKAGEPTSQPSPNNRLGEAMRYACLQGGKRFRACLVYASGELVGAPSTALDAAAAAIEMIHAYSLVHDDLPAMDDDALRRGQATCHIQYDEATAILVGDALQSLAFECLATAPVAAEQQSQMVLALAHASGHAGMAGGQALDMAATDQAIALPSLEEIHRLKTGALIQAAIKLGALASPNVKANDLAALGHYGQALGLAFQVADDILDETQSSEQLGKQAGADALMNKNTYPRLMGLAEAQAYALKLEAEALESLAHFGDNSAFLRQLASFAVHRDH